MGMNEILVSNENWHRLMEIAEAENVHDPRGGEDCDAVITYLIGCYEFLQATHGIVPKKGLVEE